MSRRLITRAVYAPLVIAIATSAVPPADFTYSQIDEWVSETLPATLARLNPSALQSSIGRQLSETGADLHRRALESAADIVHLRQEFTTRLSAATDYISSGTDATFARVDAWMMSVSLNVIAALPGAPSDLPSHTGTIGGTPPQAVQTAPSHTAIIAAALVSLPPLPAIAIEQTYAAAPAPKSRPAEPVVAAVAPPAPQPARAAAPVLPEVKGSAPPPAEKPVEKMVLASLGLSGVANAAVAPVAVPPPAAEVKAVREETPPVVVEPKTVREDKSQEKQVLASLGKQATATDTASIAASEPPAAVPELAPYDASAPDFDQTSLDMPAGTNRLPTSSPLKLRALTRADIPPAEKLASLGSSVPSSGARNLPPEQQRVAYDAPAVIEEPKSIGRRKWIDDANKYQGLGSPEALLEALKHMGAGAKSLGLPASLWCADFMNMVLRKSGVKATGSRAAKSYLEYGQKISEPRVGAIAIFSRGKNGGHIGIVRGTDGNGNPIIVSGNHNNKVAEATYPKARVLAYVVPK